MHHPSRRELLGTAAAAATAHALLPHSAARAAQNTAPAASTLGGSDVPAATRPIVIASGNGLAAVTRAMELLRQGVDPLDAVIAGVAIVEDDPADQSVGYGGLPNEEGVVELDASVMHGPTHESGAVASLRNIRHPAQVARRVMQRTDHALLVGDGALRFAKAHGFKEEDLLTDASREAWLKWKESHSNDDDWLPPASQPDQRRADARTGRRDLPWWELRPTGTINCCAVTAGGDVAGVTTTSGLAFKIPGRVGDSPIIGAGLYVDNAVGAAGSTGRGEANIQNCSSSAIVELMRAGRTPAQAVEEALKRICDRAEPRLRDEQGRPSFNVSFYAVSKSGQVASGSIWSGATFAVHDGAQARKLESFYLFKSPRQE